MLGRCQFGLRDVRRTVELQNLGAALAQQGLGADGDDRAGVQRLLGPEHNPQVVRLGQGDDALGVVHIGGASCEVHFRGLLGVSEFSGGDGDVHPGGCQERRQAGRSGGEPASGPRPVVQILPRRELGPHREVPAGTACAVQGQSVAAIRQGGGLGPCPLVAAGVEHGHADAMLASGCEGLVCLEQAGGLAVGCHVRCLRGALPRGVWPAFGRAVGDAAAGGCGAGNWHRQPPSAGRGQAASWATSSHFVGRLKNPKPGSLGSTVAVKRTGVPASGATAELGREPYRRNPSHCTSTFVVQPHWVSMALVFRTCPVMARRPSCGVTSGASVLGAEVALRHAPTK